MTDVVWQEACVIWGEREMVSVGMVKSKLRWKTKIY